MMKNILCGLGLDVIFTFISALKLLKVMILKICRYNYNEDLLGTIAAKCDFAVVKRKELKGHVKIDHKDGIINVMSVILQQ